MPLVEFVPVGRGAMDKAMYLIFRRWARTHRRRMEKELLDRWEEFTRYGINAEVVGWKTSGR